MCLNVVCVRFVRWRFGQSIGSELNLIIAMILMTMVANTWDRRDTCHTPSLHSAPSDKVSHLRRSFSSVLKSALKGWGAGAFHFFLIYKICFVDRFAYFYPFLTTILTPPARPKIMSCLKGKGLKFMGSIIAFFVQLFFLIKWLNCDIISGSLLQLRQGVPPMKWWYQSLMANCSKKITKKCPAPIPLGKIYQTNSMTRILQYLDITLTWPPARWWD